MTASGWRPRRPPVRVPLVERTTLLRSLEELVHEGGPQVALVSAPAGFGKTTIGDQFRERCARHGVAVGWAELGSQDGSPRGVWRTVVAALEATAPRGVPARSWPRASRRADDMFVSRLHQALADLPEPFVLVLDDLESVAAASMRQLGEFVRRMPGQVRVVLMSRHDPPFPLHEMRLAGQLVELRATDLAFTPDETAEVLSGRGLGVDDIAAAIRLTEGWPAGVQLARALLRAPGDGARLSGLFNAQTSVLSDYLFNEAFTSQTPQAQDLLLRTSVVPVLSDGLAAALTGRSDAGESIAQMVDLGPLLSRSVGDPAGELSYRYHPLLRAYLIGELARRDRDLLESTHHRAAVWFERHADYLSAIRHALASEDTELVDAFVRNYGPGLVLTGEHDGLLHVLEESTVAPTAWASVVGACAAVRWSDATTAAKWLAQPSVSAYSADARLDLLRASTAMKIAGLTGSLDGVAHIDSLPAAPNDDLQLLTDLNHVTALAGSSDIHALEREAHKALHRSVALGREVAELQCRALIATAALGRGDFVEAGDRVASARTRCVELGRADEPSQGLSNAVAAWVAYQALDDSAAQGHVATSVAYTVQGMDPSNRQTAMRMVTLLGEVSRGGPTERSNGDGPPVASAAAGLSTSLRAMACFTSVRAALAVGRPDGIRTAIDLASAELGPCGDVATMRAMALNAQRRGGAARKTLQPVIDGRLACHSHASLAEALLLAAAFALEAHRPYDAFGYAQRALVPASASGAYRPLAEAPTQVRTFLYEQVDRLDPYRGVIERVQAYMSSRPESRPLISPLTARELDILRELPTLNRLAEIAGDLLISTNTVKTHIRGIYRKLGVSSRKDAVAEARRLNIL